MLALQDLNETGQQYTVIDVYLEKKDLEGFLFDVYISVQRGLRRVPYLSEFLKESEVLMFYTMLKELEQRLGIECLTREAHRVAKYAETLLESGSIESVPEDILANAYRESIYAEYMHDLMIYLRRNGLTFYDDRTPKERESQLTAFRYRDEEQLRIIHHIKAPQREVW